MARTTKMIALIGCIILAAICLFPPRSTLSAPEITTSRGFLFSTTQVATVTVTQRTGEPDGSTLTGFAQRRCRIDYSRAAVESLLIASVTAFLIICSLPTATPTAENT